MPRSIVDIAGVRAFHMPVSQINAWSAFKCCLFNSKNLPSDVDPVSSSPSINNEILQGSFPLILINASHALIKVINCPLSSDAPRAQITGPLSPGLIVGLKGGLSHDSSGSIGWTS